MDELNAPGIGMSLVLGAILVIGNIFSLMMIHFAKRGEITPDGYGGIRTSATRASDAAWDAAHTAAWPWARALNGAGILFGAATMALGNTVTPFLVAAGAAIAFTAAGAITQMVVGHRAAQRALGER